MSLDSRSRLYLSKIVCKDPLCNFPTFHSLIQPIFIEYLLCAIWASKILLVVKNPPTNARDTRNTGSIPGSGRSPGIGNGNPLQYSCLENFMDRGAWQPAVHGATKGQTRQRAHT